jgi:hypothetical protein
MTCRTVFHSLGWGIEMMSQEQLPLNLNGKTLKLTKSKQIHDWIGIILNYDKAIVSARAPPPLPATNYPRTTRWVFAAIDDEDH